jgi:hypothetical protein
MVYFVFLQSHDIISDRFAYYNTPSKPCLLIISTISHTPDLTLFFPYYFKHNVLYYNNVYKALNRSVFRLTSKGGGRLKFFFNSIIQTQNLQVKFLVIFKSGESLVFFFDLMLDPHRIDFCVVLF